MAEKIYEKHFESGSFVTYNDIPVDIELTKIDQIHSADIVECSGIYTKADGIICKNLKECHNCNLAIKTADCLPILILGKHGRAMIHAGWKGLKSEILKSPKLQIINPYYFFIGPYISQLNYKVKESFRKNFPHSSHFHKINGSLTFDLASEARDHIVSTYKGSKVEESGLCTFDNAKLNSYRKDKTKKRNYNLFIPRPK